MNQNLGDRRVDWAFEGFFTDCDGRLVKCYDHCTLMADAPVRSRGIGPDIDMIPAGSEATVLFFTSNSPVLVDVECDVGPGCFYFAHVPAEQLRLRITAEELRGAVPPAEQRA